MAASALARISPGGAAARCMPVIKPFGAAFLGIHDAATRSFAAPAKKAAAAAKKRKKAWSIKVRASSMQTMTAYC